MISVFNSLAKNIELCHSDESQNLGGEWDVDSG